MNTFQWLQILVVSLVVGLLYNYLKTSQLDHSKFYTETFRSQFLYLPERMTMTDIPTQYRHSIWKLGNQSR
jgi:hypothetical protein